MFRLSTPVVLVLFTLLFSSNVYAQTMIGNEGPVTLSSASSPFDFSLGTSGGSTPTPWHAVCVSSTTDWDLDIGGVASTFSANTADFLVANGHLGTVTPLNGTTTLWSGAPPANARLDYTRAPGLTMFPGDSYASSFVGGRVIQARQIYVGSPPVTQRMRVTGSSNPNIEWFVFSPGIGPQWRDRSQAAAGPFTLSQSFDATFVTQGYYLWVVVLNGGAGATDSVTLSLSDPSGGGGGGGGDDNNKCTTEDASSWWGAWLAALAAIIATRSFSRGKTN